MTAGRTNIRWLALALIILASGVSYVLRTNVSVIGESMMTDLGLTEFQLGMIFSAFAAGYAVFQFPGAFSVTRPVRASRCPPRPLPGAC